MEPLRLFAAVLKQTREPFQAPSLPSENVLKPRQPAILRRSPTRPIRPEPSSQTAPGNGTASVSILAVRANTSPELIVVVGIPIHQIQITGGGHHLAERSPHQEVVPGQSNPAHQGSVQEGKTVVGEIAVIAPVRVAQDRRRSKSGPRRPRSTCPAGRLQWSADCRPRWSIPVSRGAYIRAVVIRVHDNTHWGGLNRAGGHNHHGCQGYQGQPRLLPSLSLHLPPRKLNDTSLIL